MFRTYCAEPVTMKMFTQERKHNHTNITFTKVLANLL